MSLKAEIYEIGFYIGIWDLSSYFSISSAGSRCLYAVKSLLVVYYASRLKPLQEIVLVVDWLADGETFCNKIILSSLSFMVIVARPNGYGILSQD
jgi:hypothetical protein